MGSEIHAGFIGEVPKAESQDLRSRKIPRLLACQTVQVPGPRIVSTRAPGVVPMFEASRDKRAHGLTHFFGEVEWGNNDTVPWRRMVRQSMPKKTGFHPLPP